MAFQDRNRNRNKKPDVPSQREWLNADPIFTRARDDIGLQWKRYGIGADRARARTRQDYRIGAADMRTQARRDRRAMLEDFAARGMGASGAYATAQNRYEQDFRNQMEAANRARQRGLKDIKWAERDQEILKNQQLWNARNEALLRRIQKYSLPAPGA